MLHDVIFFAWILHTCASGTHNTVAWWCYTHISSRSKVLKSQASPFRYPFILDKESWCMLLHAVIVDLYYNSDVTHSRVDRAPPTYIGVYACVPKFADTDPSKKKFADTDQWIGTKKAWQRTTTLVLFLECEHHAHRPQHSWSLNAGGLVAGALWLSELSACKPDDSVYHSAACTIPWSPQKKKYVTIIGARQGILSHGAPTTRHAASPSPSRTWRLAQLFTGQPVSVWIEGNWYRQHALSRTHSVPSWAESYRSPCRCRSWLA